MENDFFIPYVYASMSKSYKSNSYSLIFMLILFLLIFYFMILSPQRKRIKDYKNFISSIFKGDEVITNFSLVESIVKVRKDGYLVLF